MKRICLFAFVLTAFAPCAPAADFTLVASRFGSGGSGAGKTFSASWLATATGTRGSVDTASKGWIFPGFFAAPDPTTLAAVPVMEMVRTLAGGFVIAAAPDIPGMKFQSGADLATWTDLQGCGCNPLGVAGSDRAFFRQVPVGRR